VHKKNFKINLEAIFSFLPDLLLFHSTAWRMEKST